MTDNIIIPSNQAVDVQATRQRSTGSIEPHYCNDEWYDIEQLDDELISMIYEDCTNYFVDINTNK